MKIPQRPPLSVDAQSLAGLARDTADHRVVELRHLQDLGVIIHHLKTFDFCFCQAEQVFATALSASARLITEAWTKKERVAPSGDLHGKLALSNPTPCMAHRVPA